MKRIIAAVLLLTWSASAFGQSAVPANGFPPPNLPTVNSSISVTNGGTYQTVLAAIGSNRARRSLTIQNNNSADTCWVFIGSSSATAARSIALAPGQAYTRYLPFVPSDAIQATCTTTGDTLYVDTQ